MKRVLPLIFALIVAVLSCPHPTLAQQLDSTKTETKEAELREKALAVLESLTGQIGGLQSPENRARIGLNIAESLWRHDEKRARALFQLVQDDIKLGLQSHQGALFSSMDLPVFLQLREDAIRRIAKHDAELAFNFLKESFPLVKDAQSSPDGSLRSEASNKEKGLEVQVGKALARNNPESALSLARKTLAHGFDIDLLGLLLRLNLKHKNDARILYKEIVSALIETDLRTNGSALQFSCRLAVDYPPPAADEPTFRQLLDFLLKSALSAGCATREGASMCYTIGSVVPAMERHFPTRAAQLKRWVPEYIRTEHEVNAEFEAQLNELEDEGTVDEILSLAAKYPRMEGEIFFSAMRRAELLGDFERAYKIANDYKGDPETRERLIDRAARYEIQKSVLQDQLDQIYRELNDQRLENRIEILLSLANHTAPHDPKTSLKLLGQIRQMVDTLPPGTEQTRAHISIAVVYCLAKNDQGFAIMEVMVPKLNELIAAGAKLDGYDTKYLRSGEWNMSAGGEIGDLLTFLSHKAGYFAWYDFERAMNLAAQFERGEIRMMAQLKLAQGILSGHSKRVPNPLFH